MGHFKKKCNYQTFLNSSTNYRFSTNPSHSEKFWFDALYSIQSIQADTPSFLPVT